MTSHIIRDKATGEAVAEIFNEDLLKHLNTEKYEAVPVLEHLQSLNKKRETDDHHAAI